MERKDSLGPELGQDELQAVAGGGDNNNSTAAAIGVVGTAGVIASGATRGAMAKQLAHIAERGIIIHRTTPIAKRENTVIGRHKDGCPILYGCSSGT
jgi:hypothetical protein